MSARMPGKAPPEPQEPRSPPETGIVRYRATHRRFRLLVRDVRAKVNGGTGRGFLARGVIIAPTIDAAKRQVAESLGLRYMPRQFRIIVSPPRKRRERT